MAKSELNSDYFINPEGIKLYRLIFLPTEGDIKAVVFLSHGLFEHCQAAYNEEIIKPLTEIGCMVISHDHQGHGQSEGNRGIIYNFSSLVRDVLLDIEDVIKKKQISDNIPVFIYGHSMGGLISVYASLQSETPFTGMILEGPALLFATHVSKLTIFFGKLTSFIFPRLPVARINYDDICSDPRVVNDLKNDKLRIHSGVCAKTCNELYKAMVSLKDLMNKVNTPFIIGHGEADKICEIEGSKMLMNLSQTEDKLLIPFPNAKHQIRLEQNNINIEFRRKIIEWVKLKIGM